MNRPDLFDLLGKRVTVTNPGRACCPACAAPVTGTLVALADFPTLILVLDDGRHRVFPQDRCKVTPADGTPPDRQDAAPERTS